MLNMQIVCTPLFFSFCSSIRLLLVWHQCELELGEGEERLRSSPTPAGPDSLNLSTLFSPVISFLRAGKQRRRVLFSLFSFGGKRIFRVGICHVRSSKASANNRGKWKWGGDFHCTLTLPSHYYPGVTGFIRCVTKYFKNIANLPYNISLDAEINDFAILFTGQILRNCSSSEFLFFQEGLKQSLGNENITHPPLVIYYQKRVAVAKKALLCPEEEEDFGGK